MDWVIDRWDIMKDEIEINNMWDTKEGKQIISELLDCMSKKIHEYQIFQNSESDT